jgi:hypothetical protein
MPELFVVQRETQIAAPRASVFAFLTDPEKIVQWMGSEAVTEMHPGGLYLLKGVEGIKADFTNPATMGGTSGPNSRIAIPRSSMTFPIGWPNGSLRSPRNCSPVTTYAKPLNVSGRP